MKNLILALSLIFLQQTLSAQPFVPSINYTNQVIGAFAQGGNGDFNCASIAVIKCTLATFGADAVVKQIIHSGNTYTITLRNQEMVLLTDNELNAAKDSCGFISINDTAIANKAQLLYAIMAKRAVTIPDAEGTFDSCTDFSHALLFLHGKVSHGVDTQKLPQLLGLKGKVVNGSNYLNFVLLNLYHAVFASFNIFDNYGSRLRFNWLNFRHHFGAAIFQDFRFTRFVLIDQ